MIRPFKIFTLLIIAAVGFVVLLPQSSAAQEVPGKKMVQCRPSAENSPSHGIGKRINDLLAFGCCLNHCITDWILSDKCDTRPDLCDFSREKPLCE